MKKNTNTNLRQNTSLVPKDRSQSRLSYALFRCIRSFWWIRKAVVGVWYEVFFQITLIRSLRGGISILHGCICVSSFIEKADYCTHNIDVCCSNIQRKQLSIALNVEAIKHGFNTYLLNSILMHLIFII